MQEIESFLETFPLVKERDLTKEEHKSLIEKKVPNNIIDFFEKFGIANAHNFFYTTLPQENIFYLECFGIDPKKCFVFLKSVMGQIIFSDEKELFSLMPISNNNISHGGKFGFMLFSMNLFTCNDQYTELQLNKNLANKDEMFALFPAIKKGGNIHKSKYKKVLRDQYWPYLASLYNFKAKNLPANLKLKKKDQPEIEVLFADLFETKTSGIPTNGIVFKDQSFHFLILSALWKLEKVSEDDIRSMLEGIDEELDESDKINWALKKLKQFKIFPAFLSLITSLENELDFQLLFEEIIGVETGGEDDYMELSNINGIESLTHLRKLDLEYLNTYSGSKTLDLSPLKNNLVIQCLVLGNGSIKNVSVVPTLNNLKEIKVPKQFDKNLLQKLSPKIKVEFDR